MWTDFWFEKYDLVVNPSRVRVKPQEDEVVLRRRTPLPPFPLPSQLSFLLWFVVITKIYACCSTNLLPAIMSLSEQSRDGAGPE